MPTANEFLADAAMDHAVDLYQYSTGVVRRLIATLNRVDVDLAVELQKALERLPASSFTVERLERLLGSVRKLNEQAYAQVEAELAQQLQSFTAAEAEYQGEVLRVAVPEPILTRFAIASVTQEQVYAAALSRPFQGRLLRDWAAKVEADRMEKIRNAVRVGYVEGETPAQIARRIRGTRENKYADGMLNRPRLELEAVVRTAVAHTAEVARELSFAANADIIAAVAWTSTLDTKTSPQCRIRDGLKYTVESHKPIGHKVPWLQGPGRIHWNCRSASRPVLKSWRELGFSVNELPASTRASMDGQVGADVIYADWIKRQSAYRQDQVLGPVRAKLMREGRIEFEAFYTNRGDLLSIDELRKRNAAAFERAGMIAT